MAKARVWATSYGVGLGAAVRPAPSETTERAPLSGGMPRCIAAGHSRERQAKGARCGWCPSGRGTAR